MRLLFIVLLIFMACCDAVSETEYFSHCNRNDVDGVAKLLKKDSTLLNKRMPGNGQTCIMSSVLSGATEMVKFMLESGADCTIGEEDGYTPMHGAGFQGRAELIPLLVAHGLNPSDMHSDGYTPIHRAAWGAEQRHADTILALLQAGVKPSEKSRDGKTANGLTKNKASRRTLIKWEKQQAKKASENDL